LLVSFTVAGAIPSASALAATIPTNLVANGEPTATTIPLQWTASTAIDSPIIGYGIEGQLENPNSPGNFTALTTLVANTGSTDTTYTLTGLSAGNFYKLYVYSITADGNSQASVEFLMGTQRESNQSYGAVQIFNKNTQHGSGSNFASNQSFTNTQDFSAGGQTFGVGNSFAANQSFTGEGIDHDFGAADMEFGSGTSFNSGESFGAGGDFDGGVQNFQGSNTFGSGSSFATDQDFSTIGTQTFQGANTFGNDMKFASGQDFSSGTHTFGTGMQFNGNTVFKTGQAFGAGAIFDDTQAFGAGDTFDFTGTSMQFGDADGGIDFGAVRTFGDGADFDGGHQIFYGANTFGDNNKFASGQDMSSGTHTFGSGAIFTGNTVFATGQAFGAGAIFDDTQTFGAGDTFDFTATGMQFGDADGGIDFGKAQTFGPNADFDGGIQTFVGQNTFPAGASFFIGQDFSSLGTQTFQGANTFGNDMKFATNQDFSAAIQTFGSGITLDGNVDFADNQAFGAGMIFDDEQVFTGGETYDFTAIGMKFGDVDFGTGRTFGQGSEFAAAYDFTSGSHNHDFTAVEMVFKAGTVFPSGETFGIHPDFDGVIDFPDNFTFPAGSEFFANQSFASSEDPTFADFGVYAAGMGFGKARNFQDSPYFDGATTFVGVNTFGAGAEFNTGPTFTAAQTFSGAADFGANTDFTAVAQSITTGSQFGSGSTFITDSSQTLPASTVMSSGLLLESTTCTTSTCLPTDDSKVLEKGEKNLPGVNLAPIKNTVTKDKPTLNIEGLGITLDMGTVSTDGNVDVDVLAPDDALISSVSTEIGNDGSLEITTDTGFTLHTISSVVNISKTGSTTNSGDMTITLPYTDDAVSSAGVTEEDLTILHYVGSEWIEETACTVNTSANEITCTGVTSLSPFSVGGSSSSAGGGTKDFIIPTFTTDLEINGVQLVENSGETITVTAGELVNIDISATDNFGPENITHLDIYYNHDGNKILNNLKESYITFENEELISTDPNSILDSVTMLTLLVDDFKKFTFDVVFGKSFDTSDVLVRAWDLSGNTNSLYYNDALKVVSSDTVPASESAEPTPTSESAEPTPTSESAAPASESAEPSFIDVFDQWAGYSSTSVSDTDFLSQLGIDGDHIPKWYKQNNAKWYKDGLISQTVFVAGLGDLSTRGILQV
jgi:hypothetical protein